MSAKVPSARTACRQSPIGNATCRWDRWPSDRASSHFADRTDRSLDSPTSVTKGKTKPQAFYRWLQIVRLDELTGIDGLDQCRMALPLCVRARTVAAHGRLIRKVMLYRLR